MLRASQKGEVKMKRLLSLVLSLSLFLGLMPAYALENSGVNIAAYLPTDWTFDSDTRYYNFDVKAFTYENTEGFFRFHSKQESWNPALGNFRTNKGTITTYSDVGNWYALALKVPASGEYTGALTYGTRPSESAPAKADVYVLTSDEAKSIEAAIAEKTPNASIDFEGTKDYEYFTADLGMLSFESPGEVVIVFKTTQKGYGIIRNIAFRGGVNTVCMGATASLSSDTVYVGETATITPTAYLSDRSIANAYPDEITYESSNASIASVDENGTITGCAPGMADITATINWYGEDFSATKIITVEPNDASGVKVENYIPNWVWGDWGYYDINITDFNYDNTNNFFRYHSRKSEWNPVHSEFRTNKGAFVVYHTSTEQWYAIGINVPVKGEYAATLNYGTLKSTAGKADVYLFAADEEKNIEENLIDGNKYASVDFSGSKDYAYKDVSLGTIDFKSAGEYILVIKPTAVGYSVIRNFHLNGGDGLALMQADMTLSGKNRIILSGTLSDAAKSVADMSTADVSYESLNPDIATVSETGKVTVLKAGKVNICADITYGRTQLSLEKEFDVVPPVFLEPAKTNIKYNFLAKSEKWTAPLYTAEPKRTEDIRGITYDFTTATDIPGNWQWHSSNSSIAATANSSLAWVYVTASNTGRMRLTFTPGEYVAFTIKVDKPGRYLPIIEKNNYFTYAGDADIYIIPYKLEGDIAKELNEDTFVGTISCLDTTATGYTPKMQDLKPVEFEKAGEYTLVIKKAKGTNGDYVNLRSLTLDGENEFKYVDLSYPSDTVYVEETMPATAKAYFLDGTEIDAAELDVRYSSSDPDILKVSRDGTLTGIADGKASVIVTIKHGLETHSAEYPVKVLDASGIEKVFMEAPESLYITDRKPLTMKIQMKSGLVKKLPAADVRYEIVSQIPAGIAAVDTAGYITAHGEGTVTIVGTTWYDGARRKTAPVEISLIPSGKKSDMTIYTREMRDAISENVSKHTWARNEVKEAKNLADKYVDKYDYLYNLTIAEGIPRSRQVGANGDPYNAICRYCGSDTAATHGGGGVGVWGWDMMNRPWKIQCPDCKRLFPTNDFQSFYELGLVNGIFDREVALEKHHELFGDKNADKETEPEKYYGYGVKGGYLTNNLYSDLENVDTLNCGAGLREGENEATWGVDDGWGYRPKDADGDPYYAVFEVDENGEYVIDEETGKPKGTVQEIHNHIAFYNYRAWQQERDILDALKIAYVYTGEAKYGRAGAVVLDRVADIWADMDTAPFTTSNEPDEFFVTDGGRGTGKIQGSINDCVFATSFTECADAFFPILEDDFVIDFLSQKAERFNLENKKESAYDIWRNWEEGILETTFDGVKKVQIYGNFGQLQHALTNAAIALDKQPRTNEMLDFVYKSGGISNSVLTGGNVMAQLVDTIDRDGMNNEASPNYNYIPPQRLLYVADVIGRYTDDAAYNMLENSKFVQMYKAFPEVVITTKEAVQIGDSGTIGGGGFIATIDDYILAYKLLRETEIGARLANYLWLINGETAEGLHYDIFTKNPDELENEIEDRLDADIGWKSELMSGFGFAVLRSGAKYETTVSQHVNNKRAVYLSFGKTNVSHAHADGLNMGIVAYDLNMTPDLGYPSNTGTQPERLQWISTTLSHNTVVVDEKEQAGCEVSYPLHYDDAGKVKLIDVDSSGQYAETDIYRRTLVTVEVDDNDSYVVDFFRILGGKDHLFSFHVAGDTIADTSLELGEEERGSYADADWPQGPDPISPAEWYYDTYYPRGYSWLHKTQRTSAPVGKYDVDFEIKDYRKNLVDSLGLHLKMTMLNDFDLSEVAIATGYPPNRSANKAFLQNGIKYVLARRESEQALDSLFTTVYEPYKESSYIKENNAVEIEAVDGTPGNLDTAKAIRIEHKSGRIDYVMYATNNGVTYQVRDGETNINFRGFLGVYSIQNGENIYSYLSDGDILGEHTAEGSLTGEIVDFSRDLSLDNFIEIKPDKAIIPDRLVGKMIIVDNDTVQNGAYHILGAESTDDGNIMLDIGTVSVIRRYKNADELDGGFVYNINAGQSFKIANSFVEDSAPEFTYTPVNTTVTAGSSIEISVNAKSAVSADIRYELTEAPRGASIDVASGDIRWKPDSSQVGKNHFAVKAYDEFGRYNILRFDVIVYGSTTGKPSDTTDKTEISSTGNDTASGGSGGGAALSDKPGTDDASDQTNVGEGVPARPSGQFADISDHAWAEDSINALVSAGIIKGTSASTFSPAMNITRADFAILLVRALGFTSDNTENFADVTASDYFAPELATARNTGIVNGIGDNKFAPRNHITRQDMMVIVHRVLQKRGVGFGVHDEPQHPDFDTVAPYARDAVTALVGAGLVNGRSGCIAPIDYTTRAEVAVLIKRILEYKESEEEIK